jgi:outer membrane protein OmpA-like peptidoglycan-associated protein
MKARLAAPVAVVGLLAIGLAQGIPNRHSIEDNLTRRSTAALEAAGVPGARVSFTGRDGSIVVSRQSDVDSARAIVEGVEGVRVASASAVEAAPPVVVTPTPAPVPSSTARPEEVQRSLTNVPPITFENDSATLDPPGRASVARAAQVLLAYPGARVRIEGHTDSNGTPESNLALSQARAQSVLNALVSLGIAADRMSAVGFGETRPKVPDTSPENMAINRRVEFVVL